MTNRFKITPLTGWPDLGADKGTCRFVSSGDIDSHPYEVIWKSEASFDQLTEMYAWLADTPGLTGSYTRWRRLPSPLPMGRKAFYFSDLDTATLFKLRWR